MKTIWNEKRCKSGINKSDMANKLGMSIERYTLIEKGFVKMPTKLVDTFNSIVKGDKNLLKLEKLEHEKEINDFCNYLIEKNKDGILNLDIKMGEFNVENYEVLSKLLGYKSTCLLYTLKRGEKVGYDFKNKLYTFFNNELNIQPIDLEKKTKHHKKRNIIKNYTGTIYTPKMIKEYCEKNNMSIHDFEDKIGVGRTTIQWSFKRDSNFSPKTLAKIDNYFKSLENRQEVNEEMFDVNDLIFPELPKSEEVNANESKNDISTIEKVRGRIIDKQHKISQKQMAIGIEIANLRKEIEEKEQEYESLTNEISIYNDILIDLRNEE